MPVSRLNQQLDNLVATAAPTVNDDSGDGYQVGSFWFWTAARRVWTCVDNTAGAAVWREMNTATNAAARIFAYQNFR